MSNPLDNPHDGQPVIKRNGALTGRNRRAAPLPLLRKGRAAERTLDAVDAMRARRNGRLVDDFAGWMEDDE